MFLIPQDKPIMKANLEKSKIEVKNVINYDKANDIKAYALDEQKSGLHRRGSKNTNIEASFSTCLINDITNPIYEILDSLWKEYGTKINSNITFIEKYEIKCYYLGDKFGSHNDGYRYICSPYDRKVNLVIQLSDENDYEGGELFVGPMKCSKEFGTAIFFPSHYHHHVTEITKGQRFSLIGHAWGPYNE